LTDAWTGSCTVCVSSVSKEKFGAADNSLRARTGTPTSATAGAGHHPFLEMRQYDAGPVMANSLFNRSVSAYNQCQNLYPFDSLLSLSKLNYHALQNRLSYAPYHMTIDYKVSPNFHKGTQIHPFFSSLMQRLPGRKV